MVRIDSRESRHRSASLLPLTVLLTLLIATFLAATPVRAQSLTVTDVDESQSVADVIASVSIQGPADVNQAPTCQRLGIPCLSPRSAPDFGIAMSTTLYPAEAIGLVGEFSLYANRWYNFWPDCAAATRSRAPDACAVLRTNFARSTLAGVKLRTPLIRSGSSRLRLFCQALAGPQWSDVGPVRYAVQPGAGIDTYLRYGIILHMEYDYRFVTGSDARDLSTTRFLLGVGVPIGSR